VEWAALVLVIIFVSLANNTTVLSIAAPLVFALVVLVFAFEKGWVSGMLQARPLLFLGTVSYSIYMTHVFVAQRLFDAVNALGRFSHINPFTHRDIAGYDAYFLGTRLWHGDVAYVGYIALVIVISSLTYRWIEKPAREWVRMRVHRGWSPLRSRELPSV
jgi:peptidoglycan/LPS O-acetylase OafA/YrhL